MGHTTLNNPTSTSPTYQATSKIIFPTYSLADARYLVYKGSHTDTPENSSWEATSTSGSERKADTIHSPSDTIDVYQEKGVTKEKRVGDHQETADIRVCHARKNTPMSTGQCTRYVVGHFKVMN